MNIKELSPEKARHIEQWVQKIVDLAKESEAKDQRAEFCSAIAFMFAQTLTFVDEDAAAAIVAGTLFTAIEIRSLDNEEQGMTLQ